MRKCYLCVSYLSYFETSHTLPRQRVKMRYELDFVTYASYCFMSCHACTCHVNWRHRRIVLALLSLSTLGHGMALRDPAVDEYIAAILELLKTQMPTGGRLFGHPGEDLPSQVSPTWASHLLTPLKCRTSTLTQSSKEA